MSVAADAATPPAAVIGGAGCSPTAGVAGGGSGGRPSALCLVCCFGSPSEVTVPGWAAAGSYCWLLSPSFKFACELCSRACSESVRDIPLRFVRLLQWKLWSLAETLLHIFALLPV